MLDRYIVIAGSLISFVGCSAYAIETLRGRAKPNRVSWFLWTIAPAIAFAGEISKGANIQALLTFVLALGGLLGLVASFVSSKAYWKVTKLDILCGIISILALAIWGLTGNGNTAIIFSILSDFFAATPTLIKAYRIPKTESYTAYGAASLGSAITILTIKDWTVANYAFPMYIAINMGIIALLIIFPKLRFPRS